MLADLKTSALVALIATGGVLTFLAVCAALFAVHPLLCGLGAFFLLIMIFHFVIENS